MTAACDVLGEDDASIWNADATAVRYLDLGFAAHIDHELTAWGIVVVKAKIGASIAKENAPDALQLRDKPDTRGLKGNLDPLDPRPAIIPAVDSSYFHRVISKLSGMMMKSECRGPVRPRLM